jgi:putative flippase GtrA
MATFIKAQTSSAIATAVDFAVTIVLKELFHCWYLLASILGTIGGGLVNFCVNRSWVFQAKDRKIHQQAVRYILVWVGNLVLVSAGVFLLTHYGELNYVISKIITSVAVAVFYNYTLQKRFVFK